MVNELALFFFDFTLLHLRQSRMCHPQNMSLWHKDYFDLVILRRIRYRRSSGNRVEGKFTLERGSVPGKDIISDNLFSPEILMCMAGDVYKTSPLFTFT